MATRMSITSFVLLMVLDNVSILLGLQPNDPGTAKATRVAQGSVADEQQHDGACLLQYGVQPTVHNSSNTGKHNDNGRHKDNRLSNAEARGSNRAERKYKVSVGDTHILAASTLESYGDDDDESDEDMGDGENVENAGGDDALDNSNEEQEPVDQPREVAGAIARASDSARDDDDESDDDESDDGSDDGSTIDDSSDASVNKTPAVSSAKTGEMESDLDYDDENARETGSRGGGANESNGTFAGKLPAIARATKKTPKTNADGWYASGDAKSCTAGCAAVGLVCTNAALFSHNSEVDTSAKVLALIKKLGGSTSSATCSGQWGEAPDVPNWYSGGCFYSAKIRGRSLFDCKIAAGPAHERKQRLCYCHHKDSIVKSPTDTPFYSSAGEITVKFSVVNTHIPAWITQKIWPNMRVSFNEGTRTVDANVLSAYTQALLTEESPFEDGPGSVKLPVSSSSSDQLGWGEYVVYSRKQVCYIAANVAAGNKAHDYSGNGLSRLIPHCDGSVYESGFKRALLGLLAACAADPTLVNGAQGPVLVVAKSTSDLSRSPASNSMVAKSVRLSDAGLRTCRFRDGSLQNRRMSNISQTPTAACNPAANVDFMREGNKLQGQVKVDITAAWIGGYILAAGGCGGFGGGQDERLMFTMPEVMVLSFFLAQRPSSVHWAGVALQVPAYILGPRTIFSGLDGTSKDIGLNFNHGKPTVNSRVPLKSDLVPITINGDVQQISRATPFLGFQSINQMQGMVHNVPLARRNQHPLQVATRGAYSFKNQVAAWYNAVSLTSWHPDVRAMLKKIVVAIGSGPWGAGVWWGNSQVFFLAAWLGHAVAASTWNQTLPLDYYIYSSFTENPSNQCLVHDRANCEACLKACDHEGGLKFPNQRYCCMAPAPWVPSAGLFDGKPCIPHELASSICGSKGLADIVDSYVGKTVAEVWRDVEAKMAHVDLTKSTVFDALLKR